MKTNEIVGKKIIDKNVKEVGKIAEMTFDTKTFKLTGIYGSTGNPISKKYHDIKPEDIMAIGDYLQVSVTKEELMENTMEKIPQSEENHVKSSEIMGKKVLDCNGNESGKVSGINIDIDKQEITSLLLSKTSSFTKTEEAEIEQDEITGFGDYILINKVLEFVNAKKDDEKEEETQEAQEAEEDEEKVNININ
ncbi:MAG: PRC-barrel domain-containing protein [Methanosphaera sp.]|nr:PRC-barrel domain-containing protein [Methanosphaera sp.]